jgi:hypothetical protein
MDSPRFIKKPLLNYVLLMRRQGADIWETIVSCDLFLFANHLILNTHFLRVSVEVGVRAPLLFASPSHPPSNAHSQAH